MTELSYELVDDIIDFYERYCKEDVGELLEALPSTYSSLWIDWMDVYRWNQSVASDVLVNHELITEHFTEALVRWDLPVDVDRSGVTIRFYNLGDEYTYHPAEIRNEHVGKYVGIRCVLGRITDTYEVPSEIVFECNRCGSHTTAPQLKDKYREPHQCQGCERQGPFQIVNDKSTFTDECKLLLETPPDAVGGVDGGRMEALAREDLIEEGGEFGLAQHAGEEVIVYGTVERTQRGQRGKKSLRFDPYLMSEAIEFVGADTNVDIEAHRDEFERLATDANPVDTFANSIAPELYTTPEWEYALRLGVAYLFGAPRIETEHATFRGDIHALLISDYGMGKSTFMGGVQKFSPKCMKRSAAGLASDVGLTAAAVQDDFGDGGWTIKPGILVRGNGGHVILDEIDKGPDQLSKMNDGLEGDQQISVNKSGKDIVLNTRVGLLAAGNPKGSRFDPYAAIAEEIGIDQSLLSRFDGIVTMRDQANVEVDSGVAEHIGKAYKEASEAAAGDRDSFKTLHREVTPEVGRAWVQYARENINPQPTEELIESLSEWYATEMREINKEISDDESEPDPPVPITARAVEDTIRFASAFARVHLSEEIREKHIEMAKDLAMTLAAQTFRDGRLDPGHGQSNSKLSDSEATDRVRDWMENNDGETVPEPVIAKQASVPQSKARRALKKLAQSNLCLADGHDEHNETLWRIL